MHTKTLITLDTIIKVLTINKNPDIIQDNVTAENLHAYLTSTIDVDAIVNSYKDYFLSLFTAITIRDTNYERCELKNYKIAANILLNAFLKMSNLRYVQEIEDLILSDKYLSAVEEAKTQLDDIIAYMQTLSVNTTKFAEIIADLNYLKALL